MLVRVPFPLVPRWTRGVFRGVASRAALPRSVVFHAKGTLLVRHPHSAHGLPSIAAGTPDALRELLGEGRGVGVVYRTLADRVTMDSEYPAAAAGALSMVQVGELGFPDPTGNAAVQYCVRLMDKSRGHAQALESVVTVASSAADIGAGDSQCFAIGLYRHSELMLPSSVWECFHENTRHHEVRARKAIAALLDSGADFVLPDAQSLPWFLRRLDSLYGTPGFETRKSWTRKMQRLLRGDRLGIAEYRACCGGPTN